MSLDAAASSNGNNSNNPQAGQGRPLPKKEGDAFKNLVKWYESKQYKKALKQADLILRKFPNHGETLAMKGLTMYYYDTNTNSASQQGGGGAATTENSTTTNKKDEAHELVKAGLRHDMRSHVCWHVYGLLHRADRNYLEAIKAYKQALRMDSDNLQILRDLSLLQIQMRDLEGFVSTRNSILSLKPNAQIHWISFALAKHLVGDLQGALQVIDIYLSTLTEGSSDMLERNYEPSELQMYKSHLLLQLVQQQQEEEEKHEGEKPATTTTTTTTTPEMALKHLEDNKGIIMDRGAWLWNKAMCYFKLKDWTSAQSMLLQLMHRGATDDYRIHTAYMCAILEQDYYQSNSSTADYGGMDTLATTQVLSKEERTILLTKYEEVLGTKFPKSQAVRRIPLTLVEGADFTKYVDKYMRQQLIKGVPSLAMDLMSLLLLKVDGSNGDANSSVVLRRASDPTEIKAHEKYKTIVALVQSYMKCLESDSKFATSEEEEQDPSTLFWTHFLYAGLLEFAADYTMSLDYLSKCLDHTPTAVDVYEVQSRVFQKMGDMAAAVDAMDKGRMLDQQDRYMNNQTTKIMLQANMPDVALERIGLFTNNDDTKSPNDTLYDMQCSWYELELADCYTRQAEYGKALQKYAAVMKHFEDIHEDQFDFHSYCIRKVTLRAYCNVLDWEDNLWGQPYYRRAAEGTIRIYLRVHDDPKITAAYREPDYSGMSAAEKKKAKAIARKKKKQAEKTVEVGEEEEDGEAKEMLLKDTLLECQKYSAILSKHAPKEMTTWMLQYDVAIRRGKIMMAMQALFKARALDPMDSELLTRIVDFSIVIAKNKSDNNKRAIPLVVQEVVDSELVTLLNNHSSVEEYLSASVSSLNSTSSLSTRLAIMNALLLTNNKSMSGADAAKVVLDGGLDGRGCDVDTCRKVLAAMKAQGGVMDTAIATWTKAVQERFPLIKNFE